MSIRLIAFSGAARHFLSGVKGYRPGTWLLGLLLLTTGANAALADTCVQATPGSYQWQGFSFAPQSDLFTYYFHAMPQQAGTDTLVGLSQGPATDWSQLAAIVRFNPDGYVDVRDGDVYRVLWKKRYDNSNFSGDFRLQVDMQRKTYSVWFWSWDGDAWLLLAQDFHFRTQQSGVTQLDHFTAEAETGGLDACAKDPAPWTHVGGNAPQWSNTAIPARAAYSRYELYVQPTTANMDGLVALSNGPQTFWTNLAAIVRFNSDGMVDVRNGDVYQADTAFAYVPGVTYRIYISVNISTTPTTTPSTYTVSIAPVGGSSVLLAYQYRFRTEQQGITQIDNVVSEAESGGLASYVEPRAGY